VFIVICPTTPNSYLIRNSILHVQRQRHWELVSKLTEINVAVKGEMSGLL